MNLYNLIVYKTHLLHYNFSKCLNKSGKAVIYFKAKLELYI